MGKIAVAILEKDADDIFYVFALGGVHVAITTGNGEAYFWPSLTAKLQIKFRAEGKFLGLHTVGTACM